MNRRELIDALSTSTGSSKADADRAIGALLDIVSDTLKKVESLSLVGFGSFEVRKRAARTGRNPKTDEELKIKAGFYPISTDGLVKPKALSMHFQLPAFSWGMESLDIVEDICPRFSPGAILSAIYSLALEHAKETFRCCIAGTAAYRTHAANQMVPCRKHWYSSLVN